MCGIVGIVSTEPVNQQIYDSLLLLQHRGQDSTGIATADGPVFHMAKARGQVREAFRTRDMRSLIGNMGLGHVRYTTKGAAEREEEAQPFYVNAPYGIILVHNGNLTNTRELSEDLFRIDRRHVNSTSDTEMLLNVLATELQGRITGLELDPDLLLLALTHRSFAYENGGIPTNERLEFLGDSILGQAVTVKLYRDHPDLDEGELAKRRASLVSSVALADVSGMP